MSKQKLSLEDILNEYSNDKENKENIPETRLETEKLINSAVKTPEKNIEKAVTISRNHSNSNRINDGTLRRPNPANDYKPSDINKPEISFINSPAMDRLRSPKNKSDISAYDGAVVTNQIEDNYTPKIRRMSDSTRAKEAEEIKKKKRRKKSDFTYNKETPDGEYMYIPPTVKKKKKRNIAEEAKSPEHQKEITDIVPSPQAIKQEKPITPAPRADITSINLCENFTFDSDSIDIHIAQEPPDYKNPTSKRTKRMVDFNYYGDVEDVGRDIYELKSTIFSRFIILSACAVLSIYMTIANQFSLPIISFLDIQSNTLGFTSVQILLGIISIIASSAVIINGLKKFFTFKADSDSMTALTSVICLISAIIAFFTPDMILSGSVNIYMPVAVTSLLFNTIGKILIINRASRNFEVVSKDSNRYGIVGVQDDMVAETLTRGTLGDFPILATMRKTDFLTDFLKYTYSSDISDKFSKKTVPFSFFSSLIIAGCMTIIRQGEFTVNALSFGLSLFSMLLGAVSCMGITLVTNIPLNNASKKTIRNKGIILGYQSIDDFYDTNSLLIEAQSLFPEGSVTLAGIKVFSDTKIDEALLEAASLTHHAGSMMKGLFNDVIAGKKEILYPIENFSYEDSMGLCGWINNKRVLFGSRELMTSHNIEGMPTKTKENEFTGATKEALYLSISGNLAAMFVVEIKADKNVKNWINRLDKNNIHLIIKSVDSCITLKKLSQLFNIPEEIMRILPKKLHSEFDNQTQKAVRLSASMACSGKFSELAQLITATKHIHSCSIIGLILQAVSIFLGLGLASMLIISKAFGYNYMSASALIIYNLVCTLITIIVVNIKKI